MLYVRIITLICLAVAWTTGAEAVGNERRVALVIGNGAYSEVPRLPDPGLDADAVGGALRDVGFTKVTVLKDATHEKLRTALRSFAADSENSDWSVLYYAGHGIEVGGKNFLIPVDAHLATDSDVEFEAIPMQTAIAAVRGARKLRLVILDACRDDPFLNKIKRSSSVTRSLARGLARMDSEGDLFIVYAAQSGQIAMDGDGGRSPFAAAFLKHVETPGLEINLLFRRVHREVLTATNNRQEPQFDGNLPSEELFFKALSVPAVVTNPVPATVIGSTLQSVRPEDQAISARTPDASASPRPPSKDGSAAPPRTPETPLSAENVHAAPPPPPTKTASLEPPPSAKLVAAPPPPAPTPRETATAIQTELRRVGCEPGTTDGAWTLQSRTALRQFAQRAHFTLTNDEPNAEALDALRTQRGLICPPAIKSVTPAIKVERPPVYSAPRHPAVAHQPKRQAFVPRIVPPPVVTAPPRRIVSLPHRIEEPRDAPVYHAPRQRRLSRQDGDGEPRPAKRHRASSGGAGGCFMFNGQSVCD